LLKRSREFAKAKRCALFDEAAAPLPVPLVELADEPDVVVVVVEVVSTRTAEEECRLKGELSALAEKSVRAARLDNAASAAAVVDVVVVAWVVVVLGGRVVVVLGGRVVVVLGARVVVVRGTWITVVVVCGGCVVVVFVDPPDLPDLPLDRGGSELSLAWVSAIWRLSAAMD